jgi:hypothetical protein
MVRTTDRHNTNGRALAHLKLQPAVHPIEIRRTRHIHTAFELRLDEVIGRVVLVPRPFDGGHSEVRQSDLHVRHTRQCIAHNTEPKAPVPTIVQRHTHTHTMSAQRYLFMYKARGEQYHVGMNDTKKTSPIQ